MSRLYLFSSSFFFKILDIFDEVEDKDLEPIEDELKDDRLMEDDDMEDDEGLDEENYDPLDE